MKNYWMCIVGPTEKEALPNGADSPMRNATEKAFMELTSHESANMWSGWGLGEEAKERVMKAWNAYPEEDFRFDFEAGTDDDVIANKTLRKALDASLQNLKECPKSRERSLAITKLQESIMWLGMDLKRLNEPNPYPQSYNPENTKIEPTADDLKL